MVLLEERTIDAAGTYDYTRVKVVDFSADFDAAPTQSQLRERSERYVTENAIGVPSVSLTVEFEPLEQHSGYEDIKWLEQVLLCDTVNVEFPKLGVSTTAKVVKVTYDALREKWKKVELGDAKATLADTIVNQQKELAEKPGISQVQSAVNQLTAAVLGAKGGAVRLLDTDGDGQPDELYVADHVDPAQAVKVWRLNYEGLAASKNGYNGPFVLGMSLESGVLAEFMTACYLNANMITAGVLRSQNGDFSFNLDTGEMVVTGYATKAEVEDAQAAAAQAETTAIEAKNALAVAEQNLANVEARVGTTEEELNSAQREVANAQAAVDAAMEDLLITKQNVAELKIQSDDIIIRVKSIEDYGVDKVTTSMGYTFNDQGLHIQKSGQEIVNTLDDEGMSVTRSGEVMLQADKDGVIATDVRVRNFLIVGTHARFEDYTDGTDSKRTACFWIDG